MNRVTIELWFWLSQELGAGFESLSEMRSVRQEVVKDSMTIRQLLDHLARRHPAIARIVFDRKAQRTYPHVVVNYNDRVISPHVVHDQPLKDGDKITILPMYMGG